MLLQSEFTIALFGDAGVGKTCWLKKLRTFRFEPKYRASSGVEEARLSFEGKRFKILDFAGQEKYSRCRNRWNEADGVIVMFSIGSILSIRGAMQWISKASVLGKPIMLVANKCDCHEIVSHDFVNMFNSMSELVDPDICFISVKTGIDIDEPIRRFVLSE